MASYYSGPTLSREQIAQIAYNAGFRGDVLAQMVGISIRESGGVTGAHRTDNDRSRLTGDMGLWQVNSSNLATLKQAGIVTQASELFDPVVNAKAAMYLYKQGGLQPWAMTSSGWQAGGNPMHGVNLSAAQQAVQSAANKGLLGQDWKQNGTTGPATSATSGGPTSLPRDTKLVQTAGGISAMYQFSPGVWIKYVVPRDGTVVISGPIERMTAQQLNARYKGWVDGGSAAELEDIPTVFGTYRAYADNILNQVFVKGDPRRNDAEIIRVLAQKAGRPDMSTAEFENLLKTTKWYQTRTQAQIQWNDVSEAERQSQRQDTAARMAQAWLAMTGSTISTGAKEIQQHLEAVASGKMGFGQWTETFLKPRAKAIPESPWNRQLREEKEAQRQRPIDVENTVNTLRQTLTRWGLTWDETKLHKYATGLRENTFSDDDVNQLIQNEAAVKYPWKKDKTMETIVAAAPWIDTYNTTMERQGSLQTAEIRQALATSEEPWAFEQRLKQSTAWSTTKNGEDAIKQGVARIGSLTGMA
jgi:hypothetical protein